MKVVADDKIPLLKGVLEPYCDSVVYLPGGKTGLEDVKDADALITRTRTKWRAGSAAPMKTWYGAVTRWWRT